MAQKISYEDAFPTFQQKCSELFEANLLLQAQVDVLERRLAALQDAMPKPPLAGDADPAQGLGAAPAEQAPYGNHANLDQQNDLERVHG